MNAERLHALLQSIASDLQETQAVASLTALVAALQNQSSNPQAAQFQVEVGTVRDALIRALKAGPSNQLSPSYRHALEEMDVEHLLGASLAARVQAAFSGNDLTPAVVQSAVQSLVEKVTLLEQTASQTIAGLSYFEIGSEGLEPGEFEVNVMIPRAAVDTELRKLGEEFVQLESIFLPFEELTTGSRPPLQVKSISASAFTAYIVSQPETAACIALAIERLVALYKQLLEIRELRHKLKENSVPDSALTEIDEHANSVMREGMSPLVNDIFDRFCGMNNEGRVNELKIEVTRSLNKIANRIDEGYNFEVRTAPLPSAPGESEDGDDPAARATYAEDVLSRSEAMRFINRTGEGILSLPEGDG